MKTPWREDRKMTLHQEMDSLSIFFPAYNEEQNLRPLLDAILEVAPTLTSNYEVIVVNDGSSDRTEEISAEYAAKYDQVRLINHETNIGYGAALQSGFRNASKDFVFYM